MDVLDVRAVAVQPERLSEIGKDPVSVNANDSTASQSDAVLVETHSTISEAEVIRRRANEVISIVNVAAEATSEIDKLVRSIGGIAELAQSSNLSENRRSALETEANQLVEEIVQKAQKAESGGVKPLVGDSVRFEVEEKLGKALEFVLPEGAAQGFGIGQVLFSRKDSILDTIARVENAQRQITQIRSTVEDFSVNLRKTVDEIEVRAQNNEASQVSIRNVDAALQLASQARTTIGHNPQGALDSVGNLNEQSLSLLK